MNTLIKNATILSLTSEDSISFGDICIKDDKISFIGKKAPEDFHFDKIIDATGSVVLPSFVNAHTHSSMVLMRNYKDSESGLHSWLEQVWAIEAKLNETDIAIASQLAIAEMIKSGITAFADMYYFHSRTAKEAINAKIRSDIGLTLIGDLDSAKKTISENLDSLLSFTNSPLVNISIAPHAIYTVPKNALLYARDVALSNNLKIHTHLSETKLEVEDSIKNFNLSPVKYLQSLGLFDAKSFLAHCVHFTDEELKLLKDYDTTLVHCPSSNCKLSSGIANVKAWRKEGLSCAFGTDGASSNNNLNMIKEINLGCMLSSVFNNDTQALRPYDALRMATYGGSCALGLNDEIGTLEVNKKADLIIVDISSVNNTPVNNIYSALVYSTTSEDIKTVICNGNILMEDRKLLTIDEDVVKKNANKVWLDICKR